MMGESFENDPGRASTASSGGVAMRVVALLDSAEISGPGRQLAALAGALAPAGVELVVVTFHRAGRPRSPYRDYLERAGVHYAVLEENGPLDLGLVFRLERLCAHLAPEVVQTHGYKPAVLVNVLRRRGAAWSWIAFFHGATAENRKVKLYNWLHDHMLGSADRVVVMSREDRARLAHLGEKVSVVHNAAIALPHEDAASGEPPVGARTVGDDACLRIGVVGRLSPEKGVDVFLHACRALTERGVNLSATVAGDGPERQALEHLRDSLGLAERVHFVGATAAVQALYAGLDLLVIPSRSEGLPNVLLEALRADLPVVATAVGAIPEVLDSPLAGLVVPAGSAAALADAIPRAAALRDQPTARQARRDVVERFSLRHRAEEHLRLYAELGHPSAAAAAVRSTLTGVG
jgi:glycosyltransferase involved in cell wall biosynthesis